MVSFSSFTEDGSCNPGLIVVPTVDKLIGSILDFKDLVSGFFIGTGLSTEVISVILLVKTSGLRSIISRDTVFLI